MSQQSPLKRAWLLPGIKKKRFHSSQYFKNVPEFLHLWRRHTHHAVFLLWIVNQACFFITRQKVWEKNHFWDTCILKWVKGEFEITLPFNSLSEITFFLHGTPGISIALSLMMYYLVSCLTTVIMSSNFGDFLVSLFLTDNLSLPTEVAVERF